MKTTENLIRNSIQHLKEKLQMDKLQLQNIKSDLNRSKSPIHNYKDNSNKENQSCISNMSKYRNSLQSQKSYEAEIRKQHKKEINAIVQKYQERLITTKEKYQLQIQNLKTHYDDILREKDSYIQCLQSALPQAQSEPDTPRSSRLGEIHQIKSHYQYILREVKERYESIIQMISEENEELKFDNNELKSITFKNQNGLFGRARETLTKYQRSSHNSSYAQFSTSHIEFNGNASISDNCLRQSMIDNSGRLSSIFRDKLRFNKSNQSKQPSLASIDVEDYNSINTEWIQRSVYDQQPLPLLPIVHEKQTKASMIYQKQ